MWTNEAGWVAADLLSANRKLRVSTSESAIPGQLWVLLIGGGAVVMAFTFLFGTRDLFAHACAVAPTAGLMGFVMHLIFALEHPFVGALSVKPNPTSTCSRAGRTTSRRTRARLSWQTLGY
ncbi:MAG: hypothetical protein QOF25_548 [Mycobacterium sp.]|jgi:purine-cytosine permease-like protein|nr:hypothetical protein [Mycobacterium sp.]